MPQGMTVRVRPSAPSLLPKMEEPGSESFRVFCGLRVGSARVMLASTLDAKPFREVLMDDSGAKKYASVVDLVGLADNARVDLINGEIHPRFEPSYEHESASSNATVELKPKFNRTQRSDGTGGWWINTNVHVEFGHDVLCPDILGWRRDRVPQKPTGFPVRVRPDWVCEVTVSTLRKDTVDVPRILHAAEVPWYWRIDVPSSNVLVFEWTDKGYVLKHSLFREDGKVRIPPFGATEVEVAVLLGDDPSDDEPVSDLGDSSAKAAPRR